MIWWWLALAHAGSVVLPDAEAIQVDTSSETLVEDAFEALGGGRFDEAAILWAALAQAGAGDEARFWQGLALYEAGRLRQADRVLDRLVLPEARNLAALVDLDAGRQADGVAALQVLREEPLPPRIEAHVDLNLGLAWLDQGRVDRAEGAIRRAKAVATGVAEPDRTALITAADESLALVALLRGDGDRSTAPGLLTDVGDALRQGDRARAEAALAEAPETLWPRHEVERLLATAALRRAGGQLAQAQQASDAALRIARQGGLARETALALASSAVAHTLAGRHDLARELLEEAADTAGSGGYRVLEVDSRSNLGLVALRLGAFDDARLQADLVADLLTKMQYPEGQARLSELRGMAAAVQGDVGGASSQLQEALRWHESRDHHADAARLATALVGATAAADPAVSEKWARRAAKDFRRAGDPLGEAHVSLARGLALVRLEDLPGALAAFATAAQAARDAEVPGSAAVAEVAEANAASALVVLGASADAAAQAAALGLDGAVAHHQQLQAAMQAYDRGMTAYDGGRFAEAQGAFTQAAAAFEVLDEDDYGIRAHRGRLWAVYNQAVPLPPIQAWPLYSAIQPEAEAFGDPELAARVVAATAMAAHALGLEDAGDRLRAAAERAAEGGYPSLAARCHAALAEHGLPLDERVRQARLAFGLDPDAVESVYALYSVAVDAYNADDLALAAALAQEALPHAGKLKDSLQAVVDAATAP
jgi:tetratricopeptide (TPR) repeat protein